MFGFQSDQISPCQELKHEPGSDQINELQWALQTFIGDKVTRTVAELHLPAHHMHINKVVIGAHVLHLANIVHLHHQS
jgi:hypothetical protein